MTRSPVLVLGTGPTAVFATDFLCRLGFQTALVGSLASASILPVATPEGPVSLLPVFPTLPAPAYPPSAVTDEYLSVRRVGSPGWIRGRERAGDSLVGSILPDDAGAAMAVKQFGTRALTSALDQVQEKIRRAYTGSPVRRAGYIDGVSPYLPPMLAAMQSRDMQAAPVRRWSPNEHRVELQDDGRSIDYSKLVYVADPGALANALGVDIVVPDRAPAEFSIYLSDRRLDANQLVYDLDEQSPIFRAFSARPGVVIVQESQLHQVAASGAHIAARLKDAFGSTFRPFGDRFVHPTAYPVESLSRGDEQLLDSACVEFGIVRFGRNAMNRYVDLHELNWEGLRRWSAT